MVITAMLTGSTPTWGHASAVPVRRMPVSEPGRQLVADLSEFKEAVDTPAVRDMLTTIREGEAATIEEQVAICEIPAPPFSESERAIDYARRLRETGIRGIRTDAAGNVIGEWAGSDPKPLVVLSAHLDTVFPAGTDVTVTRDQHLLKGPGIVDDCRGLAVVLAVARAWAESGLRPRGRLVFVGTVGEEGAGNLRGVRHLFEDELRDQIDAFVSIDGAGSTVTHGAVGSHRYKVTYRGPGGHSFGAFGMPNPMHALGRAIAKIADFQVPTQPKVTFSVGILEGGTSVNSIPFSAAMSVDMRSLDVNALEELDSQFRVALQEALDEENGRWDTDIDLTYDIEVIGIRPAGLQLESAPIVRAALATARAAGIEAQLNSSSTDSNIPISLGIPAVTIDGGGHGTGAHSPSVEIFDSTDSHKGSQWALLLTLALAGIE
ncbi:MAG TPA: M20/M25/M40 family metallo-hydrolase [Acidobacteriota bacterium]|nr:M20/M25/M40 family metallo-hydrolase [Acidobacteriota bacterium]